jgi:hypothetical protein
MAKRHASPRSIRDHASRKLAGRVWLNDPATPWEFTFQKALLTAVSERLAQANKLRRRRSGRLSQTSTPRRSA